MFRRPSQIFDVCAIARFCLAGEAANERARFFNEILFAEFMDSFFGDQARFPEHHVIFYRGAAAGSNVGLDK